MSGEGSHDQCPPGPPPTYWEELFQQQVAWKIQTEWQQWTEWHKRFFPPDKVRRGAELENDLANVKDQAKKVDESLEKAAGVYASDFEKEAAEAIRRGTEALQGLRASAASLGEGSHRLLELVPIRSGQDFRDVQQCLGGEGRDVARRDIEMHGIKVPAGSRLLQRKLAVVVLQDGAPQPVACIDLCDFAGPVPEDMFCEVAFAVHKQEALDEKSKEKCARLLQHLQTAALAADMIVKAKDIQTSKDELSELKKRAQEVGDQIAEPIRTIETLKGLEKMLEVLGNGNPGLFSRWKSSLREAEAEEQQAVRSFEQATAWLLRAKATMRTMQHMDVVFEEERNQLKERLQHFVARQEVFEAKQKTVNKSAQAVSSALDKLKSRGLKEQGKSLYKAVVEKCRNVLQEEMTSVRQQFALVRGMEVMRESGQYLDNLEQSWHTQWEQRGKLISALLCSLEANWGCFHDEEKEGRAEPTIPAPAPPDLSRSQRPEAGSHSAPLNGKVAVSPAWTVPALPPPARQRHGAELAPAPPTRNEARKRCAAEPVQEEPSTPTDTSMCEGEYFRQQSWNPLKCDDKYGHGAGGSKHRRKRSPPS